ncbi:hypothetical protein F5884DRAFT_173895 [Xylogone sp. PMI_703]|nr:hypothetical protein F5884DRAFT_173895 [Xylogone sp. PMI_703]
MLRPTSALSSFSLLLLGTLPARVLADQILQTTGFSSCLAGSTITVQNVNVEYNNDQKTVSFNVAGTSTQVQNVTAQLNVTAYGSQVYQRSFNPCEDDTFVSQLCPVPAGTFSASGNQTIPAEFASMIPAIAFSVPDIAAQATLQLISVDSGSDVACIVSQVTNGKTVDLPAVSYVTAGIAGAALIATGATAISAAVAGGSAGAGGSAAAGAGAGTLSPSFMEVATWFQGVAMNGMMSVNYPPVYTSFAKNFGFSTGVIPWGAMQQSIDNFRASTGGNLTGDSYAFLQNASLASTSGSKSSSLFPRSLANAAKMLARDIVTNVNTTAPAAPADPSLETKVENTVSGMKNYVEELSVPEANTFMTVLLIFAIVIASIVVGILLLKVLLEAWSVFGTLPKSLVGIRTHYWGTMARTIVNLILLLYGIWVMYSIFQFTHGDSWAAKLLAGFSLAIFTGVLGFFAFKIWSVARHLKKVDGDTSALYENKETWMKYSLFYEAYKKDFWWLFIPVIVYTAAKGIVLAAADGHGLTQTVAQLIIELLMLILLIWSRPFERKSGNVINIFIQVVRALSVVCILVFVEELGISQTTKTVTGVVLIAVQSALSGLLALLVIANAMIAFWKMNPHRKRRKEAEKMNRDLDDLTPLDARDSLLMGTSKFHDVEKLGHGRNYSASEYSTNEPGNPYSNPASLNAFKPSQSPFPQRPNQQSASTEDLMGGAAPIGTVPLKPPMNQGYRGIY